MFSCLEEGAPQCTIKLSLRFSGALLKSKTTTKFLMAERERGKRRVKMHYLLGPVETHTLCFFPMSDTNLLAPVTRLDMCVQLVTRNCSVLQCLSGITLQF